MIPKKIHYCWLSGEEMPADIKKCMDSWQKLMPDYELVLWDKNKFDIGSVPFVQEACDVKKWAFAADYIRLYALYTEGGIYLDTDVFVKKNFDDLLNCDFFTSLEYHADIVQKENTKSLLHEDGSLKERIEGKPLGGGIGIQAAVLAGITGHPYLKDCMDRYKDAHFIKNYSQDANGIALAAPAKLPAEGVYIAPAVYADVAIQHGFRYKDELQKLKNNMVIYPAEIFAGSIGEATKNSYAIHCCKGSWRDRSALEKIKEKITKNEFVRKLCGKKSLKLTID